MKPTRTKFTVMRQTVAMIPAGMVAKLARDHGVEKQTRSFSAWNHVVSCDSFPSNPNGRVALPGFLPFCEGFFGKHLLSIAFSPVVGQHLTPQGSQPHLPRPTSQAFSFSWLYYGTASGPDLPLFNKTFYAFMIQHPFQNFLSSERFHKRELPFSSFPSVCTQISIVFCFFRQVMGWL